MKTAHNDQLYFKQNELTDRLFDEKSIFFDIETTGFSPAHSQLYLIGCARKMGNYLCVDQFFAENAAEEPEILEEFLKVLKSYTTIISFNGTGFDIPYLKAKCSQFQLEDPFESFQNLDIFKKLSPLKPLFSLPNYKQKTIEHFLGLKRNDKYNGGELINIYYEYTKTKQQSDYSLLLLHNYEDVLGMIDLLPVLSYGEILHGKFRITDTSLCTFRNYDKQMGTELIITLQNDYPVPTAVSAHSKQGVYINMHEKQTVLRVPVFVGELRFFYPDPENYYYLPEEDAAVHKSVSSYVDKEHRQPAKASNCYTRKEGEFLPQYKAIITEPVFRKEYKDKISYFELSEEFLASDELKRRYVDELFTLFVKSIE